MDRIKALVGCQMVACAEEVSFHSDMVRFLDGEPICETCYEELPTREQDGEDWSMLPPVTLADLSA